MKVSLGKKKFAKEIKDSDYISRIELIAELRKTLEINRVIRDFLFASSDEQMRQQSLKKLKFFNFVKRIIIRSAHEDTKMVNLTIFCSLLKEIRL